MGFTYEEAKLLLQIIGKKMTKEEWREQKISFAAGQCCLSDREGRSIEWWIETTRRVLDEQEGKL